MDAPQTIRLSNRDFDAFVEAITSDREPGEALRRAAERFKKRQEDVSQADIDRCRAHISEDA